MTGYFYRDAILEQHVRLFRGTMGAEFLFMDDNARLHRANIVDECLQSEDITRASNGSLIKSPFVLPRSSYTPLVSHDLSPPLISCPLAGICLGAYCKFSDVLTSPNREKMTAQCYGVSFDSRVNLRKKDQNL
ncbi:transposable element Tcb1 transposase [Trichonephila clavipes]|nr:transposable element Tcb1 transposase [Trichonephila clavipes]